MNYDFIVLVGEYIGGAEIFTLAKIRSGAWTGQLVMNPRLASCLRRDPTYAGIPVAEIDELEPLAQRITIDSVRTGASALDRMMSGSRVLLGNLKASATQLATREARSRDVFVHDNCNYLNLKARSLIAALCVRSRHSYFACNHARRAVPLLGRVFSASSVHYFSDFTVPARAAARHVDEVRILNVGRVELNKGQLDAAAIAVALSRRVPRVTLTLIGSVFEPEYFERIRSLLAEHSISLVQKTVPHDQIEAAMREHDLVLHTSKVESLPLVMFEAAAADVPFFAVPVGGIPEILPAAFQLVGNADICATQIADYLGVGRNSHTRVPA